MAYGFNPDRSKAPVYTKQEVDQYCDRAYDTVADMQADTTLTAGMICHTLGFHAPGDGGAAWYKVESNGTANGYTVIALDNNLYACFEKGYEIPFDSGFSESLQNNLGIFKCAKTWIDNNNSLYYGNNGNPNSYMRVNGVNSLVSSVKSGTEIDGKYPLDCMSFVMMCLLGIGFEESIFGDATNKAKYPRCTIPYLSDEFYHYCKHENDGTWSTLENNEEWERVLTWQMAEYLYDRGLYYEINDYSLDGLRIGDIVFFKSELDEYKNRFKNIVHCGIYMGIGRFGFHIICDCTGDNTDYPVRVRNIGTNELTRLCGYSRIPVGMSSDSPSFSIARPENALVEPMQNCNNPNEILWLDRPIEKWGAYLVRFEFCYTDADLIGQSFPAIKVLPHDFIFARFDADSVPEFVVNEPKTVEIVVYLSPEIEDIETYGSQNYLAIASYPTNSGHWAKCIEVIPLISSELTEYHNGVWLPPITDATSVQDAVDKLYGLVSIFGTYTAFKGKMPITINGATETWMFRAIKGTSQNNQVAIFRYDMRGMSRNTIQGTVSYDSYTAGTTPVPFEWFL